MMMTQEELADKAKLSKRTIERIEKGAPAQKSSLKLIAVALGLDPVSLIEGATPASIFDPMSKQGDRIFSGLETQEISPDDVETTRPPELTDQQRYSRASCVGPLSQRVRYHRSQTHQEASHHTISARTHVLGYISAGTHKFQKGNSLDPEQRFSFYSKIGSRKKGILSTPLSRSTQLMP